MRRATSFVLAIILFGTSLIALPAAAMSDPDQSEPATAAAEETPTAALPAVEATGGAAISDGAAMTEEAKSTTTTESASSGASITQTEAVTPAVVSQEAVPLGAAVTKSSVSRPPAIIPVSGHDIIISSVAVAGNVSYIELYNTSSNYISVADITLHMVMVDDQGTEISCDVHVSSGYLGAKSYLGLAESSNTAQIARGAHRFSCGAPNAKQVVSVEMIRGNSVYERLFMENAAMQNYIRQSLTNDKYLSGDFLNDFRAKTTKDPENYLVELYYPSETLPFTVLEFVPAVRDDCTLQDVALSNPGCRKYIKIKNNSDETVDLSQFVLRSGTAGSTTTAQYKSQLVGTVAPNEVKVVYETIQGRGIYLNTGIATVWFEDAQNVKSYDASVATYPNADTVANRGMAWSYNVATSEWAWATPNPLGEDSLFTAGKGSVKIASTATVQPCKEGQYRNPETNRCRSLTTATSTLKPCKEGQYRSEETNRCRSIAAAAASVLKPCADDQFRNPETNRCKKIASAEDILAPCKTGYERNAETNRCRKVKVANAVAAGYPVQPYHDNTMQGFWWGIGAVGVVAAGYAAWEWRHEITRVAGAVWRRFPKNRV